MSLKKPFLLAAILLTCVGLSSLFPPVSKANMTAASPRAQSAAPKIIKAVLVKKTVTIEGENFAAGAKLLVNGEIVKKSFNDELTPTTKLIVNKANRRLPFDEVVTLQVQNPDGQISGLLGFFTGTTFTSQNTRAGYPAYIQAGRKFLVHFSDPEISWTYVMSPGANYPIIEALANVEDMIPDSQGFYLARQPGLAPFILRGERIGNPPFSYLVNLTVE